MWRRRAVFFTPFADNSLENYSCPLGKKSLKYSHSFPVVGKGRKPLRIVLNINEIHTPQNFCFGIDVASLSCENAGNRITPRDIHLMRMESHVTRLSFKKATHGVINPKLAITGKSALATLTAPVRISDTQVREQSPETRMAEKIVSSCFENVRFLNQHLRQFEEWLILPAEVENALYLAYTIEVKDDAPFAADDLRLWLAHLDIETQPGYSFVAPSYLPESIKRRLETPPQSKMRDSVFCLPCHHYVSIPGLMHIVHGFESFFADSSKPKSPLNYNPAK
jgi:hypothetical protein